MNYTDKYSNILIVTYLPIFKYSIESMESEINVNKILIQKTYFMVPHDTGHVRIQNMSSSGQ